MKADLNIKNLVGNLVVITSDKEVSPEIKDKLVNELLLALNHVVAPKEQVLSSELLIKDNISATLETIEKKINKITLDSDQNSNTKLPIKSTINVFEIEVPIKVRDLDKILKEVKRLRHHEATTVGLWAIDRNPKKVKYKWIKREAFKIKQLETEV